MSRVCMMKNFFRPGVTALCCLIAFAGAPAGAAGSLPDMPATPFYASLRSDNINVRTGPGVRYPIRWIYKRRHWPVKVVSVFEDWYKLEDIDGVAGWAHKSLVSTAKFAVVNSRASVAAMQEPDPHAERAYVMEPGVIVALDTCAAGWCRITADGREGWTEATILWGAR